MTALTFSLHHPLTRKRIILQLWRSIQRRHWTFLFGRKNENTCINPLRTILEEKGSNWDALKNLYGKELLHRCYSCEFHFKQSVNRRLKYPISKYGSLCKQILESSYRANFERSIQKLEDFIDEQLDHEKLKDWLKRWLLLKWHIFY